MPHLRIVHIRLHQELERFSAGQGETWGGQMDIYKRKGRFYEWSGGTWGGGIRIHSSVGRGSMGLLTLPHPKVQDAHVQWALSNNSLQLHAKTKAGLKCCLCAQAHTGCMGGMPHIHSYNGKVFNVNGIVLHNSDLVEVATGLNTHAQHVVASVSVIKFLYACFLLNNTFGSILETCGIAILTESDRIRLESD